MALLIPCCLARSGDTSSAGGVSHRKREAEAKRPEADTSLSSPADLCRRSGLDVLRSFRWLTPPAKDVSASGLNRSPPARNRTKLAQGKSCVNPEFLAAQACALPLHFVSPSDLCMGADRHVIQDSKRSGGLPNEMCSVTRSFGETQPNVWNMRLAVCAMLRIWYLLARIPCLGGWSIGSSS